MIIEYNTSGTIRLEQQGRFLKREIESAPAHMLPREFIMNAIDNAIPGVPLHARFDAIEVGGVKKLCFSDNACGMSIDDLTLFGQTMGLSLNLEAGKDDNHGVGARLIGLRSHPHGLVYYSKVKGGKVNMIAFSMTDDGPQYSDIQQDVVSPVDLGDHGTAVVFMGNSADQDTVAEPFVGGSAGDLRRLSTNRFWRTPKNVCIRFGAGVTFGNDGERPFYPLEQIMKDSPHFAYRKVNKNGVAVHYGLLDKRTAKDGVRFGGARFPSALGGVIYKNEIYQLDDKQAFHYFTRILNLGDVGDRIYLFVELPDNFPLVVSSDRTKMTYKQKVDRYGVTPTRQHVQVKNFRTEIFDGMPDFIKREVEKSHNDELEKAKDRVRSKLTDALRRSNVRIDGFKFSPDGDVGYTGAKNKAPRDQNKPNSKPKRDPRPAAQKNDNGEQKAKRALIIPSDFEVRLESKMAVPILIYPHNEGTNQGGGIMISSDCDDIKRIAKRCFDLVSDYMDSDKFREHFNDGVSVIGLDTFGYAYVAALAQSMEQGIPLADIVEGHGTFLAMGHVYDFEDKMVAKFKAMSKNNIIPFDNTKTA